MKTYEGWRDLVGANVTVDGKPLPPRFDLKTLSKAGFEWTYEGAGPAQLALALLADHLGDDAKALALYDPFMRQLGAALDHSWELTRPARRASALRVAPEGQLLGRCSGTRSGARRGRGVKLAVHLFERAALGLGP